MNSIKMNNGIEIPQLGFGTAAIGSWQQDDDYVKDVILRAIDAGYRHIDTASIYGNERSVGRAIKESGIPREEFFLTSKVWDNEQGFGRTRTAFENTLARLDTDYLDLYLIHWPLPEQTKETWQALEALYEEKRVRAPGLSNFRRSDIEFILSFAKYTPTYNQLEIHPYMVQKELTNYCEENNIVVSCWSPLGSGAWSGAALEEKPISDKLIGALAAKYKVSNAQIILKWDVQQNRIVIPKAESQQHIVNNMLLDGFELEAAEIEYINALDKNHRFGGDPATAYKVNLQMVVPA